MLLLLLLLLAFLTAPNPLRGGTRARMTRQCLCAICPTRIATLVSPLIVHRLRSLMMKRCDMVRRTKGLIFRVTATPPAEASATETKKQKQPTLRGDEI